MTFLRATLFNICFYSVNTLMCIMCIPLLLLPRPLIIFFVEKIYLRIIYMLEKYVLSLDYEIRGIENIPKEGSYLVAAKHQSAYETFKLHILFKDPAIILKKELLSIPIWGWFLGRTDPIAINRKARKEASQQVIEGAKRIKEQGRPIIIFPQGTRVHLGVATSEKPYKIGVARMQEATDLPIIPMALNTGKFWPRKGWMKYPGKVIFEFLPPIHGEEKPERVIKQLEQQLEDASQKLLEEV